MPATSHLRARGSSAPHACFAQHQSHSSSSGRSPVPAWPSKAKVIGSLAAVILSLSNAASAPAAEELVLPYQSPVITKPSSKAAIKLSERLRAASAKMFGAFWCSHCFEQKQAFGQEAQATLPYIECFPNGWKRGDPMSDACESAKVRAFPSWVINGRFLEGEFTLEELQAELDAPAGQPSPTLLKEAALRAEWEKQQQVEQALEDQQSLEDEEEGLPAADQEPDLDELQAMEEEELAGVANSEAVAVAPATAGQS